MKKLATLVLAIAMLLSLVTSASAAAIDKKTVVIATAQEPTVFFCQDQEFSSNQAKDSPVLFQIYECLLWMDEQGVCQPWLATGYEMSADGMEYVFTLRDDVYFHNNEKMTAKDVAFTYKLCMEKNKTLTTNLLINLKDVEVLDDTHVKFILTAPFAGFPAETSARVGFIINEKYYNEVGSAGYNDAPVGTGPYTFVNRVTGQEVVLKAFDQYWAGKASIENIILRPINNISTQFISLRTGDIDVINSADVASCLQLTERDPLVWISIPSAMRVNMFFNVRPGSGSPLENDENLRKAIVTAVNKQDLIVGVLHGEGAPLDMSCMPAYTGAPDAGTYTPAMSFDVEKAKEYLAASNYKGQELRIICQAGTNYDKAAQIIQGHLMAVGIKAAVVATDSGTYTASSLAGDFEMSINGTSSSLFDWSSCNTEYRIQAQIGPAYPGEFTEKLDKLSADANVAVDISERKAITAQIISIANENAFICPLYNATSTMAFNNELEGITLNPNNAWRVYNWNWK